MTFRLWCVVKHWTEITWSRGVGSGPPQNL
jgi:hypothetical protein